MKSFLKDFGLTPKEEQIYLTCLELGEAPASTIAQKLKINRSTAYVNLEHLVSKGFIERGSKHGHKTYWASSPEKLLSKFELDQSKRAQQIKNFESHIPELEAIQKATFKKPTVKFFQGKDAAQYLYDTLMSHPEWVSFVDSESILDPAFGIKKAFWDIGYMKRDSQIPTRDIMTDCPESRELKKQCETDLYKIKLYPERIHADNIFFADRFFLISYIANNVHLLEVNDQIMANSRQILFEGLWNSLP